MEVGGSLWKGRSWQTKAEPGTARHSRAQSGTARYSAERLFEVIKYDMIYFCLSDNVEGRLCNVASAQGEWRQRSLRWIDSLRQPRLLFKATGVARAEREEEQGLVEGLSKSPGAPTMLALLALPLLAVSARGQVETIPTH